MSTSDGTVLGVTQIVNHGPASERWNLVLLSEGYQESELAQFALDAQAFVDALFAIAPFDNLLIQCAINVYRIDVASTDSGADDPITDSCAGSGVTPNTYFDATFCSDGANRRFLRVNDDTVADVLDDHLPEYDEAIIIVNSSVYGGFGGRFGTTSTDGNWERIAIHELGHVGFGLADEYDYLSGCGIDTDRDNFTGAELDQPNVAISMDRVTLKWGDLINPATPLPTTSNSDCTQCDPQPNPLSADTIGAYEGARYYHCGVYRPQYNCMMQDQSYDFCAVCQRAIRDTLEPYLATSPEEERELLQSLEDLLHGYEQLLARQPCPDAGLLKSFEGLLHGFDRLLQDRQRRQTFLERELLESFECLLYGFESLLERFVGLPLTPLPDYCSPHDDPEGLPDLIPVAPFPPSPGGGLPHLFCTEEVFPGGQPISRVIRVIVRNQGSAVAGPSVTMVEFFRTCSENVLVTLTQPTNELYPGHEQILEFEVPLSGCYGGDSNQLDPCCFRITVDAMNDVAESNEGNNVVESSCLGFAG